MYLCFFFFLHVEVPPKQVIFYYTSDLIHITAGDAIGEVYASTVLYTGFC